MPLMTGIESYDATPAASLKPLPKGPPSSSARQLTQTPAAPDLSRIPYDRLPVNAGAFHCSFPVNGALSGPPPIIYGRETTCNDGVRCKLQRHPKGFFSKTTGKKDIIDRSGYIRREIEKRAF